MTGPLMQEDPRNVTYESLQLIDATNGRPGIHLQGGPWRLVQPGVISAVGWVDVNTGDLVSASVPLIARRKKGSRP